jgi:hypothetical protein
MEQTIAALRQTDAAQTVAGLVDQITARLKSICHPDAPPDPQALQWCIDCCSLLEQEDKRFMREIKLALRSGVQVFEQWESKTISKGSKQLMTAVKEISQVLESYYARIAANLPAF